jgi:hypothetical protein
MAKFQNTLEADFTASPDKYPQRNFRRKDCRWCGDNFQPVGPSHHYCTDACRKEVYADRHYRRTYGISFRWVKEQLEKQGWLCSICKTQGFKMLDSHVSGLNVDHCHTTGQVRGLICHNCNRGLGLFQDSPEYLREAALYLERSRGIIDT